MPEGSIRVPARTGSACSRSQFPAAIRIAWSSKRAGNTFRRRGSRACRAAAIVPSGCGATGDPADLRKRILRLGSGSFRSTVSPFAACGRGAGLKAGVPSRRGGVSIGAMRNLMRFSPQTRLAAAVFAAAVIGLAVTGCDDAPSPTAPAAPAPPPPPAPEPAPIQAGDVVDRETLKSFVEAAAAEAAAQIPAAEDAYAFFDANFRPEGPWRQGEIYLFAHHLDGIQFFHAVTPETEGLDRSELEDVNGVKFLQEILAAVASGGGYVEYRWPNPRLRETRTPARRR